MTFSERIKEFRDAWESTGSPYQAGLLIPDVVDDEYFETLKPKQKFYTRRQYERKTEINDSELYDRLNNLVKENVPKSPIFTYNKRKNSFIAENKDAVMKELLQELEKSEDINENEFNKKEQEIETEENKKYEKIYKSELAEYENIFNPSQNWLEEKFEDYHNRIVDKWGGKVWVASGASVYVDKNNNNENKYTISMIVDNLTEFANNFPHKYSITAAGNLSTRTKTDKQIDEEYAQNVCALAFVYAICLFNVCLDAKDVLVSCYIKQIDSSTGNEETRYIYSVIIPRNLVKQYKMENLNTVAALMSLEGRADIRKEREIYFIDPIEWNLDISNSNESTQENSESNEELISIDFRRLNIELNIPEECEEFFDKQKGNIDHLTEVCHSKVAEFELFNDDFDAANYANGLAKFMTIMLLINTNPDLYESSNFIQLKNTFKLFFGNNSFAMGEINKLLENDILGRMKKGYEVNLEPLTKIVLGWIITSNEE